MTTPKRKVAKAPLTAVSVRVFSTRGANKAPDGGYVEFSDGKFYRFHFPFNSEEPTFSVYARNNGSRAVRLPARAAALIKALNSGENVDSSPIKVSLLV